MVVVLLVLRQLLAEIQQGFYLQGVFWVLLRRLLPIKNLRVLLS